MNMRTLADGKIYLIRRDRQLEHILDRDYLRIGDRLWAPVVKDTQQCRHLEGKHKDTAVYIIGKGPSLQYLKTVNLKPKWPVIALNEAIDYVEKLSFTGPKYFIQQDKQPICHPSLETIGILHSDVAGKYPELKQSCVFQPVEFGFKKKMLSVIVAIRVAKYMGCKQFILVSFDYVTNGVDDYPQEIPDYRRSIEAWKGLRMQIQQYASPYPVSFITPIDPDLSSSGIPLP